MREFWYFSTSASADSRLSAAPVIRSTTADSFGPSATVRRREMMGSRTAPLELESGPASRAAGAQNGGGGAHEFRLHKEIAKGGMRRVRRLGLKHHLRIAGQFDDARQ